MSAAFVEWIEDESGRIPVFFDRRLDLVDPLHDYVASVAATKRLSSPRAYASTVDAATYALLAWLRYLNERKHQWQEANDAVLAGFRDSELTKVLRSGRAKGAERIAKRTVNTKLHWVYRFYGWAQESAGLCSGIIGPKGAIKSTITEVYQPGAHRSLDRHKFPCCFPGVSGNHSGSQYFATDEDKRAILSHFAKGSDPFLVERNHLMMQLSDRVGWRASTVTGLLVADFAPEIIERSGDEGVSVAPAVQKRGYHDAFIVDHSLAARVVRFIAWRKRWLAQQGWSEARTKGHLFLSVRSGKPLGDKTLVQLLGKAFREIGVPAKRGAGHHSFRRKYADQSTREDLQARKMTGHSVAVEDVLHATARRLGQHRIDSQAPYQKAVQDGTRDAEPHKLRRDIQELESVVADKEARIAALERALTATGKSGHSGRGRRR